MERFSIALTANTEQETWDYKVSTILTTFTTTGRKEVEGEDEGRSKKRRQGEREVVVRERERSSEGKGDRRKLWEG